MRIQTPDKEPPDEKQSDEEQSDEEQFDKEQFAAILDDQNQLMRSASPLRCFIGAI
ncbi:unnamed protein product, partial [Fusarium fujikuroi]